MNNNIESMVASKFPQKIQRVLTYAEKDCYGMYHIVVRDETYGEASFHEKSLAELKWQINSFLEDGSRY